MVASDGMLESLSLLLRSELDDVKKMCSTSVRNLSNSASVQAKMVDMGMIALLIDVMSVKDDSRRSPGAVSLPKSGLLPSPIQDWQPGRPAEAIAQVVCCWLICSCVVMCVGCAPHCGPQIVVPAFPEVAAPPLLEPAEQPVDAQLTGDLGSARGLFQASALSVVALGEPLWTKLDVGDMSTSSPTMPAPLVLLPPGTAPNPKASSSVVDHTADVGTPAPASGPPAPEPDVDEELVFDFKLSSPSSEFYKVRRLVSPSPVVLAPAVRARVCVCVATSLQKQASRGPRTVMSFDPQYSKLRSPTSTLPQLAVKSPGTLGRSPRCA